MIKSPRPLLPLLIAAITIAIARPAAAYIGPGSGMMAVGLMLAVVAGIVVAIIGFLWYPFKRIFGKSKNQTRDTDEE